MIVFSTLLAVQNGIAQSSKKDTSAVTLECVEVDRISISPVGQMQPAYPGRTLNVRMVASAIIADGVFFGDTYEIDRLKNGDIKGRSEAKNRDEMFYFSGSLLFHTAIVKNRDSKVLQSQILSCNRTS